MLFAALLGVAPIFATASSSANLCLPYADKIVNAGASTVFKTLASCYSTDLNTMHTCLSTKLGVPLGCAACFGQANKCVVSNCSVCLQASEVDSEYCQVCASKVCSNSFQLCSGFGIPLPSTGKSYDACDNTKDISILNMIIGDYYTATQEGFNAITKCKLDKACLWQQFFADLQVSNGCAECFADNTACTVQNCANECILGPSKACAICSKKNCGQQFTLCSGVGPLQVNLTEPWNQCKGTQDTAILSKVTLDAAGSVVNNCIGQCLGNDLTNCLNQCFSKTLGLTPACSECLGEDSICTLEQCSAECGNGPTQDCLNCTASKCLSQFETCSGVSPAALS
jgi:hypothetical protein